MCRWCNENTEDIEHILGKCEITKDGLEWIDLENYFKCNELNTLKHMASQVLTIETNLKTLDDENKMKNTEEKK